MDHSRLVSVTGLVVSLALTGGSAHALDIDFGIGDSIALDQPRLTLGLNGPTPDDPNASADYPPTSGLGFTVIADTGASGILLAQGAHNDIFAGVSLEYRLEGQYLEQGVGGFSPVDITAEYLASHNAFVGLGGTAPGDVLQFTQPDVQAIAAPTLNLGSFEGIVGMPAMAGRSLVIDIGNITSQVDLGLGGGAVDSIDYISVGFSNNAAPGGANTHTFKFSKFEVDETAGQVGSGPLPTTEDLPLLGGVGFSANSNQTATGKTLLFDTGAQLSLISRQTAIDLGFDPDDPTLDALEVSGVGGTVPVPLVQLDTFTLDTHEGNTLVFHDVVVGIIDIEGLDVDGILGFNLFTTGYLDPVLAALGDSNGSSASDDGAFTQMWLDFTDDNDWQMQLTENPAYLAKIAAALQPGSIDELADTQINPFDSLELPEGFDLETLEVLLSLPAGSLSDATYGSGFDTQALLAWPGVAIPEPNTLALMSGMGALWLVRRRVKPRSR